MTKENLVELCRNCGEFSRIYNKILQTFLRKYTNWRNLTEILGDWGVLENLFKDLKEILKKISGLKKFWRNFVKTSRNSEELYKYFKEILEKMYQLKNFWRLWNSQQLILKFWRNLRKNVQIKEILQENSQEFVLKF